MVSAKLIDKMIYGLIGILVLFSILAVVVPLAEAEGDDLCDAGVPLGKLFAGGGVIFLVIMAGVLIAVIKSMKSTK